MNEEILYQIVAVDSEFKKGLPDKITTIFKNGITGKIYTDYDFKNHRYLYTFINDNFNIYDRLEEKDKEIERLKNIINELEEYLNQEIIEWQDVSDLWIKAQVQEDRIVLDKLKELKEENEK